MFAAMHRKIPLNISHYSTNSGVQVWKRILHEEEAFIPLDVTKFYKLNTDTSGVCKSWLPVICRI